MHQSRQGNIGYYLGQLLLIVVFAFPLLWILSLSLKSAPETLQSPPTLLPDQFLWSNYSHVLDTTPIGRYLLNSLLLVACTVAGTLLLGVPAAYALSRYVFKGRRSYTRGLLAAQLISPLIIAVPMYRAFASLNLINNFFGLLLVYIAVVAPFITWFLKSFFDTIPREPTRLPRSTAAPRWVGWSGCSSRRLSPASSLLGSWPP